jgi:hypothetical protein
MKLLLGIAVALMALSLGQKPQRVPRVEIDNVVQTDFEGTRYDVLCWQLGPTTACAEGVQLVDSGIGAGRLHAAFGRNSLATANSDEFVVTFDPPIAGLFTFAMALDPDSAMDRPRADCSGNVREPLEPLAPGTAYTTYVTGASECVFAGAILDDVRLWLP